MMRRSSPQWIPALVAVVVLSACSDDGSGELREWMEEVRRQTPVSVQQIPPPKTFTPFVYAGKDELDPYDPAKLQAALAKLETATRGGIQPDLERRKEALENFPLDTITMVGTLERPGLTYALLRVDSSVFQAKVGNHIGQNHGRITRITESGLELLEIVRDASGEWSQRNTKLELQESEK
jgi:type IV pilus assembly protein PilP